MRSSAMVAIRGLIMLVTLIAVPALALFCKSVPTLLDKAVADCERRLGVTLFSEGEQPNNAPHDAADFHLTDAPRFEASAEPSNLAPVYTPAADPHAPPAGAESPIPVHVPPSSNQTAAASFETAPQGHPGAPMPNAALPGEPNRIDPQVSASAGAVAAPAAQPAALPSQDRFTIIQARLRELGATYYLLESWGSNGTMYRFHCKMPLAGGDRHFQTFESIGPDPLAAMDTVLNQVEQWRAGRQY